MLNSGACSKDGRVHVGDRLFAIEGRDLRGVSHAQCVSLLQGLSSQTQVTLHLLRQHKQHEETASDKNGQEHLTNSEANNLVHDSDGAHTEEDIDNSLTNIELTNETSAKHSQVHHNQIFAQQHVKLAYARNSFRVKKDRQMPKIPTEEKYEKSLHDVNNSQTPPLSDDNSGEANANSSDTNHEEFPRLSKHQTVLNLNDQSDTFADSQVDSGSIEKLSVETKDGEHIPTKPEGGIHSQEQRTHASDVNLNRKYDADGSHLDVSSEYDHTADETHANVQSDTTEVTITRVLDQTFPKGYQRYDMARKGQTIESIEEERFLTAPSQKIQELLAATPPGENGFLSRTPLGEPPPPPPEFYSDEEEAPALPAEGPPSMPPPPVPRSPSPPAVENDVIEKHDLQSHEEVAQTLSYRMNILDRILNDDTLPVTNIDDLLDDRFEELSTDGTDIAADFDQPDHHGKQVEDMSYFEASDVSSPQTSAELEHALVNPFEQLERDFDNDKADVFDPLSGNGSQIMVEGLDGSLPSARGFDSAGQTGDSDNAHSSSVGVDGQSSEEVASVLVKPDEGQQDLSDVVRGTVDKGHAGPASPVECTRNSAIPPALKHPHNHDSSDTLEQVQLSNLDLHVNSHYGKPQKAHSSNQHSSFVSPSQLESDQLRELEHNFTGSVESTTSNVTVVRITSSGLHNLKISSKEQHAEEKINSEHFNSDGEKRPAVPATNAPLFADSTIESAGSKISGGVSVVSFFNGDVHSIDTLDGPLPDERDHDRLSIGTADTVSTSLSAPQAHDTREDNYDTAEHVDITATSGIVPEAESNHSEIRAEKTVGIHKTTIALDEPAPDYDSHLDVDFGLKSSDTGGIFNAEKSELSVDLGLGILSATDTENTETSTLLTADLFSTNQSGALSEFSSEDWSPRGDLNSDIFTKEEEIKTNGAVESGKTHESEVTVEVSVEDNVTSISAHRPQHTDEEEVNSHAAKMNYITQPVNALKTTGDTQVVDAHENNEDIFTALGNSATESNQTVTHSTSHDRKTDPAKAISGCEDDKSDEISGSDGDALLDILSSEQSGGSKNALETAVRNSATDEEKLSPFRRRNTARDDPTQSGSLNRADSSKDALPSLKLPSLASLESRKLSPVNTGSSTMKSSLTTSIFKTSISPKSRNKRNEEEPFTVEVLKGLLGLGIKLRVTEDGLSKVVDVQKTGPVGRSGVIR